MKERVIKRSTIVSAGTAMLLLLTTGSLAQIPKGDITIELELVASGLTAPLGVTHAGDQSGRLFIWEQSGRHCQSNWREPENQIGQGSHAAS